MSYPWISDVDHLPSLTSNVSCNAIPNPQLLARVRHSYTTKLLANKLWYPKNQSPKTKNSLPTSQLFFFLTFGGISLNESISTTIELLTYFHDYIICLLVSILIFVTYLFYILIQTPNHDKHTSDSHLLETIWTIVPIVILLFIAFPSLYLLYLIEELSSPSLTIKVIGHQWYWEYQHTSSWSTHTFDSYILHFDPITTTYHNLDVDNRLILPTSTNILFLITSADVLHSWTVPSLGIKTDACPGRLNYLSTITPFTGIYYGQCSEICGSNHSFIPIVLEFVPITNFINYLSNLE